KMAMESAHVDEVTTQNQLTKAEKSQGALQKEAEAEILAAEAGGRRAETEVPVESSKRSLSMAQERLRSSEVRAPSRGVILSINTREGELTGGRLLLRMGDTDRLAVIAEVDEVDVLKVKRDQPARVASSVFRLIGKDSLPGRVAAIGK